MLLPQLHNTKSPILNACLLDIQSGDMKPKGAFWTSTYIDGSSAWLGWCEYEQPDWIYDYNFVLTVDPDANVYVIDTLEDLERLVGMYPYDGPISRYLTCIDWAEMAKDYDGVQLTEEGQWATRYTTPGLNGWDCESTAWFRWVFTHMERV